jgi:hypothetical protein
MGAFAQQAQAPSRNNQQQSQAEGQRRPTGRLIVPVTGTLGTAAPAKPTGAVEAAITPAVTGSFAIQRFARTTEGGVAAVGTLTLSFTDSASNKARTVITQGAMRLDRGDDTGTPAKQQPGGVSPQASPPATAQGCETTSLLLGGVALDLPGLAIKLDDANVDLVPSAGEQQGTPLCDVAGLMTGAPPAELVKALNTLLDTMG